MSSDQRNSPGAPDNKSGYPLLRQARVASAGHLCEWIRDGAPWSMIPYGVFWPPYAATMEPYCFLLMGIIEPWRTPAGISYLFHAGTPE